MPGHEKTYYWDSCLFLAWLKDESATRKAGEMDGVREVIGKLKKREVRLVTSVLTLTEVFSGGRYPAGLEKSFQEVFMRRDVLRSDLDIKISKLARELREHYFTKKAENNNKDLSVPDSIHLATAIFHRVDEFHTFDEKNGKVSLGLIPLSGNVAGHKLIITKPMADNPGLDLTYGKKE